ncbi:hypothetical protein [Bacillus sp. 2205SS5-2]|uniref:hypothetical protein n=1 Tax=Bacillus sp. 2205SS5-2 TaxID=3109031 RepID=UPI003005DFF1
MFINDREVEYKAITIDLDRWCPDVSGRYLIQCEYKKSDEEKTIKCCLPSLDVEGDVECGERLESIAFYKDNIKLTIGAEGEFVDKQHRYQGYDYSGSYVSNGVQYKTFSTTEDKNFRFGVCWIEPVTEDNEVQTWFGADPTIIP